MCKLQIWRHEPAGQLWWQFRKPPWHPPCFWRSTRGRQRHWSSPPSPSPPLASLAPASSSLAPWLCLGRCGGPEKENCLMPIIFFFFSACVFHTFLLPTRMMGTLGQKCFTSGVHFSGMFSNESERARRSCFEIEFWSLKYLVNRWRNTWGWHLCLGRTEASVCRSPPDRLCPTTLAQPID